MGSKEEDDKEGLIPLAHSKGKNSLALGLPLPFVRPRSNRDKTAWKKRLSYILMSARGIVRARDGDDADAAPPSSSIAASALNPLTNKPLSANYFTLARQREMLPIFEAKDTIKSMIVNHQIVLLVGETGSGKTTQLPQYICELFPTGMIACTQPRRVAAMSVAQRVAEEMDVRLGEEVGYHVRFDRRCGPSTKVLYLTDGMLLREFMSDSNLSKFSAIIVDEAHERTVDTDIALAILKQLSARRTDLRVVVMSATLDMAKFKDYFAPAPLIKVPGRMFNVSVFYTQDPVKDYVASAVDYAVKIHAEEPAGDILVFLIGEAEIEKACARTRELIDRVMESKPSISGAVVLPLYGSLPLEEQRRVFRHEHNKRKIIFATNIAETSLTIDGVVYVIDCGFHKQNLYNAEIRVDCLLPAVISKASAQQRAGRAGRTRPGKCFRMFCEKDFATLPDQTYPEVLRTNMIDTMLLLLKLGVTRPGQFPFIDPPSQSGFVDAFTQLSFFGAVDDEGAITDFGRAMADLPLEANLARMLLRSAAHGCSIDMALIAAMLEVGNFFLRPQRKQGEADQMRRRFEHPESDHITLFNVFHAFIDAHRSPQFASAHFIKYQALAQADKVYNQLVSILQKKEVPLLSTYDAAKKTVNSVVIRKAMLEGFFNQVAYLPPHGERYRTVKDKQYPFLHQQSVLTKTKPKWVMYHTMEIQGKEGCFLRVASAVEPEWFLDANCDYFAEGELEDGEIREALRPHRRPPVSS
jgi:pre-mRNA-splicing factor ATP-dependent RNA helicase DHX15/PRP43